MSIPKKRKLDRCHEIMTPVLADELIENTPLAKVYVASILDLKNISKIIVELNTTIPIYGLTHLKRVKKRDVILFPIDFCKENEIKNYLISKNFPVDLLEGDFKVLEVAKIPPRTKKQYDVVNALWPCNFHSNKYLEKLCTNNLFNDEESENHVRYMKLCIEVARYGTKMYNAKTAAAIVVDPKINSIVAVGYNESINNPSKHEVMTAIDNVARTQNGGAWNQSNPTNPSHFSLNLDLRGIPENLVELLKAKEPSTKFGASSYKGKSATEAPTDGPYLCTNYDVYITHEPCIMCAMALIHSRARRVFYGAKTTNGALGTYCKIHVIKNLNHHYEVFSGLLENECSLLNTH